MKISRTCRLAYAAGVVDSDGCITIGRGGKYYVLEVVVCQAESKTKPMHPPAILLLMQELFGGKTYRLNAQGPNRMPMWWWSVGWGRAEECLKQIRPYLVGKADQADVALEYRRKAVGYGKVALAAEYAARLRAFKNYTRKKDLP